jgi:hypothetical protein
MKQRLRTISTALLTAILILLGLLSVAGFALPRQTQQFPEYASDHASFDFEQAAAPGFDADGRAGLSDSAWSMKWFWEQITISWDCRWQLRKVAILLIRCVRRRFDVIGPISVPKRGRLCSIMLI